jgi:hypothetical protein
MRWWSLLEECLRLDHGTGMKKKKLEAKRKISPCCFLFGTVGNKHARVEQLTDASAIGSPHATNY